MLTIIDYNIGNLGSIHNMLKRIGIPSQVTSNIDIISNASKLILPGVGHYDYGMQQLHLTGLIPILNKKVLVHKTPILGICLGVQLLTQCSDEGTEKGLGWIQGKTIAFDKSKLSPTQKIPNMGWANVANYNQSKLFDHMHPNPKFYFVHSYHLDLYSEHDTLVTAHYGYNFAAGIEHHNILGVQFHPEKSGEIGEQILKNFITL